LLSFHALSYICSSCSRAMHHHRSSCSRFMHYHRSSCSRFMHHHRSSCSRFMHHHRSSCSRFMHYHRSSCSRFMHYHHPALALASCIIIVLSFHALSCIVSCSRFMYSHALSLATSVMFTHAHEDVTTCQRRQQQPRKRGTTKLLETWCWPSGACLAERGGRRGVATRRT
jgi:hypothetical protein